MGYTRKLDLLKENAKFLRMPLECAGWARQDNARFSKDRIVMRIALSLCLRRQQGGV
jgi:hypothetical protein